MAVRDFFQKDELEEVEAAAADEEEEEADGRSLRVEEEGFSLGLWRAWSATDGAGSGSERRRREEAEWSRESALWSVTMSPRGPRPRRRPRPVGGPRRRHEVAGRHGRIAAEERRV